MTGGPLRSFGIRTVAETIVGTIDLRFDGEGLASGQVNVAYGLYPSWRGRGLATRAVDLVCQYAAEHGATEAVIKVEPENSASARWRCGRALLSCGGSVSRTEPSSTGTNVS